MRVRWPISEAVSSKRMGKRVGAGETEGSTTSGKALAASASIITSFCAAREF